MKIRNWLLVLGLAFCGANAFAKDTCTLEAAPEAAIVADVLRVQLKAGVEFKLEAVDPKGEDKLSSLTAEKREVFLRRRHEILTSVARALAFPKALGFASWAKNKIKRCFGDESEISQAEALAGLNLPDGTSEGTMKTYGYAAIAAALRTIDAILWEDYYVVTNAKSISLSTYLSASAGLGVGRMGGLAWRGLELDFGYDFEKGERFVRLSWLKQSMKSSFFFAELMGSVGLLLRQYELDPDVETQNATSVHTPAIVLVRHGPTLVGWGGVMGFSAFEMLGIGMMASGHYELGAGILGASKMIGTLSTYSANMQKTTLLKKSSACEAALQIKKGPISGALTDSSYQL